MEDDQRGIYAIIAGILPPLLGLGLIEVYIRRDVSFAMIAACLLALAMVTIVIVALADVARTATRRRARRARRSSR